MGLSISCLLHPQKRAPLPKLPPDVLFSLLLVRIPQLRFLLNAADTKELLAQQGARSFSYLILPQEDDSYEYARTLRLLAHRNLSIPHASITPIPNLSGVSYTFYFNARNSEPFTRAQYTNLSLSVLDDYEDFQHIVIPRIVRHLHEPIRN